MVGYVEKKTCEWCAWHDWKHDRCAKKGVMIDINDPACSGYEDEEEMKERLYQKIFGKDK